MQKTLLRSTLHHCLTHRFYYKCTAHQSALFHFFQAGRAQILILNARRLLSNCKMRTCRVWFCPSHIRPNIWSVSWTCVGSWTARDSALSLSTWLAEEVILWGLPSTIPSPSRSSCSSVASLSLSLSSAGTFLDHIDRDEDSCGTKAVSTYTRAQ